MARRTLPLIWLFALALTACSNSLTMDDGSSSHGTGFSKNGIPYIANDDRIQNDLDQPDTVSPPPLAPQPGPQVAVVKLLREKLREFEITRTGGVGIARFGEKSVEIKIFFDNEATAVFKVDLAGAGGDFRFSAHTAKYTLVGTLKDDVPRQTLGEMTLTETAGGDSAKIYYRAYKADLHVREDSRNRPTPGSNLDRQIHALGDDTFGWVNNWAVLRGRAVYLIDIVKITGSTTDTAVTPPIFAFKGESLQTGEQEHKAQAIGTQADVTLVGNGEDQSAKMFAVNLDDPVTRQRTEVMVDIAIQPQADQIVQRDQSLPDIPLITDDEGEVGPSAPPQTQGSLAPDKSIRPVARPAHLGEVAPAARAAAPTTPAISGNSYLRIDTTMARTGRMVRDFNRNREVPGVKQEIANYQRNRTTLNRFYKYANPFRRMIEVIGRTFDVSPAYAYLTVIESSYFTGGRYFNKDNSGVALGIFQFQTGTAKSVGMRTGGGNSDERYYFAPSACGAAKYIAQLTDQFDDGDTTLAILGYNQGQGGAAAAIYCSYGDTANRKACASRINHGMGGQEYARYIRLAKNYHYSYAEIERVAAISAAMRSYVNRKLAIFFISSNMRAFGFSIPSDAPTRLPGNDSVMPPNAIQDARCRGAVSSL